MSRKAHAFILLAIAAGGVVAMMYAILAHAETGMELTLKCGKMTPESERVCIIPEAQLDLLIANNNSMTQKARELEQSCGKLRST